MNDEYHYSIFGGPIALVILIIAMMHYGYSCSCGSCELVDSSVTQGEVAP